jgi:hypothetical protein
MTTEDHTRAEGADADARMAPQLTERERHQLLVEWNETRADFPHDKCIHQLF